MRPIVISIPLLAAIAAIAVVAGAQEKPKQAAPPEMPVPAERLPEHSWLEQLLGEWTVTVETTMGPGVEPMRFEGTESVRSIGGRWFIAEGKSQIGEISMSSLMTIGYDPAKKAFVGTWVDTIQSNMWHYTGALDEAKKVLTLSADGPAFDDPTKTSHYRDALEIVSPDHKRLTSSVEVADGEWIQFMRGDYRRKK